MKRDLTPKSITPFEFEGTEIRHTPKGELSAVDVLRAVGQKNPHTAWTRMKKQFPEILHETCKYSQGTGRPLDVVTLRGAVRLAMLARGKKATKFRDWAVKLIEGYATADPTLTADLIDRTENAEDLKRLEARARSKRTNKEINQTIVLHKGDCFAQVANMNNVSVTGKTARELQLSRKVNQTRDGMSHMELTLIAAAEELEASGIKLRNAQGNGEILNVVHDVTNDIKVLRRKYAGPVSIPHGDDQLVPLLQVEI